MSGDYEAITRGVRIRVTPHYLPQQSQPDAGRWAFAYTVEILNLGAEAAQLVSRHWIITDGLGRTEEVKGPGVVGETPRLEPGQNFTYTSGCPLGTPTGTMRGTYQMATDKGELFDAEIPEFSLDAPEARGRLN